VIASLGLGVGANTAVFALIRHTLLRPLPYPDADALVAVGTSTTEGMSWDSINYNLAAWQRASRTLAAISWVRVAGTAQIGSSPTDRIRGAYAAPNLLEVLGIRPVVGRWFSQEEERRGEQVAVLSHGLWQRHFRGDASAPGRSTIQIDGRTFTVIGVLPPGVGLPTRAEFWYPHADNLVVEVVARVRPKHSMEDVRRDLRAVAPGIEVSRAMGISIDFVVVRLHERLYGTNARILRLLAGTAVLLLLLSCTNVANLSLARSVERRRELAVCVALGASRRRLAAEVLAENGILAALAGAAGLFIALIATALLVRLSPPELAGVRDAGIGLWSVLFAAGAVVFAAAGVSIAPTIAVTRGDLRPSMGHSGALGVSARARRARSGLVVAQLAIALLLVTASGLLIRSMVRLTSIETGFDRHGLVVASLQLGGPRYEAAVDRRAMIDELVARVRAVPGVRSVGIGPPPLIGGHGPGFSSGFDNLYSVRDSTQPEAPRQSVWVKYVGASYLETFRIPIRAGRGITPSDDGNAPAVALINASAERLFFPSGGAIGRQLPGMPRSTAANTSGGRAITVVGLLPDVRQRDITIDPYPEVWLPLSQQEERYRDVDISARTDGDPKALVLRIARILGALDPELQPRRLSTMDAIVGEALAPQRFVLSALGAFAVLALVLAALGLYAVMAYVTEARTREIGLRMALGAQPRQVLLMVIRGAMVLVAAGVSVGFPLAFVSSRLMAGFVYEVDPRDPMSFLAAPAVLALAALAAAYIPARRAARVDPLIALRAD
jgi:putative ABC transport system permease protein